MDPTLLIGDIVERDVADKQPVPFPDGHFTSSATGFPQHKKRWTTSAFKQRRAGGTATGAYQFESATRGKSKHDHHRSVTAESDFQEAERRRIGSENQQKIDSTTPQEIAHAQQEIMKGLDPALVQRLLKRSTIEDSPSTSPFTSPVPPQIKVDDVNEDLQTSTKSPPQPSGAIRAPSTKTVPDDFDENSAPAKRPDDLIPITDLPQSTHFPAPPSKPDLDPSDPNFLATLHEKYFPDLPADPSKLAWMAPVPSEHSAADKDSPYYPHPEIGVGALRFDFHGRFLSPRVSRSISSSKGLHHHGEAPEAAGYTIAELAHLARSAVPAQRCIAYQTLGRILYRLGHGEWGKTEDDPIAMGVWGAVKQGRVLETLSEAAMVEGGHQGSRAYATEALWLFEKGGWKTSFKGR